MIKKVGYAAQSASGISLKIYEGSRFIGTISYADIEKTRQSKIFVASIVKFPNVKAEVPECKKADPSKLNFSLNLFDSAGGE